MAIELTGTVKPKGNFPIVEAENVSMSDGKTLDSKLSEKQDKIISDEGAYYTAKTVDGVLQELGAQRKEWDGKYSKPTGGIPKSDLASAVKTSLDKADTAYQKPTGGIPKTDLAEGVIPTQLSQLSGDETHRTVTDAEKETWNGKGTYSKPTSGIPSSDLDYSTFPVVTLTATLEDGTTKTYTLFGSEVTE